MTDSQADREMLALAYETALRSPDPSTQNGGVLVDFRGEIIARDCNRFPDRVDVTDERLERPLKYEMIEHAERNLIYQAAYAGHCTFNSVMYVPWAACADCARAIIQAGVCRLVRHKDATVRGQGRNWDGTISIADVMLVESGVEITDVVGPITEGVELLHSGERWRP